MAYADPIQVTRAYVFTYVSEFGEEGPPSIGVVATGNEGEAWTLTVPAPSGAVTSGRSLVYKNIYRTITGSNGTATYYFVGQIGIATTSFVDSFSDDVVVSNAQLKSFSWSPPPTDLVGIVSMPNGILAGFRGNELWFSEPYRPHAWPAEYQVSTDYAIVGLGLMGQTLVVCTKGFPWTATGVRPSSMSLAKIQTKEPCLSRGSIVSTPEGVYYASPNGIVVVVPGAVRPVTSGLITPGEWVKNTVPSKLRAVRFHTAYMAFETTGATTKGLMIDFTDQKMGYQALLDSNPITAIQADEYTSSPLMIRSGNLYVLDPPDETYQQPYLWRSKVYRTPLAVNLGAAKIYFTVPTGAPTLTTENTNLVQTLGANQYALFRMYADGVLKHTRELRVSGELFKLPSGYKATSWQFEIEGRVTVFDIQVASSAKELRNA